MRKIITKVGLPGGGRVQIVHESGSGMGGFLSPPGAAVHEYRIEEWRGSRSQEAETSMSIEAINDEWSSWLPARIRNRARKILDSQAALCTDKWVESVYAYFRYCYSPDGEDRNVSNCLIVKPNTEKDVQEGFGYVMGIFGRDGWVELPPPPDTHLAVLFIRQYFPDHEPRTDLIATPPQWGKS